MKLRTGDLFSIRTSDIFKPENSNASIALVVGIEKKFSTVLVDGRLEVFFVDWLKRHKRIERKRS